MKFKILIFILAIASVSCSSDDSNNEPITKANITGSVNLYDEGTTLLDDKSNMLVKEKITVIQIILLLMLYWMNT